MMNDPDLSILIPSYNYSEGIRRLLYNSDLVNYLNKIEILVYDNSTTNNVEKLIEKFNTINNNNIIYRKILNTTPVQNWNSLINDSKGEYYILIHHDEFFFDKNFFKNFFSFDFKNYDLILFNCKIIKNRFVCNHFPARISKYLISKSETILNINFLGPTGVFCIKKNKKSFFDTNLKWLVDIENYFRIIKNTNSIFFHKNSIGSTIDYSGSITKSISEEIKSLKISERNYITKKHPDIKFYKFNLLIILIIKNVYNLLTKKFI